MEKRNILFGAAFCAVVIAAGLAYYLMRGGTNAEKDVFYETGGIDEISDEFDETAVGSPPLIKVHIIGEAAEPGIYELPEGSRVSDVLEMAGGALEDADLSINLARPLRDGEQVVIPKQGEAVAQDTENASININTASRRELTALPGIGDVIAGNIVDYREKNGDFLRKDDVMNVDRVSEKLYADIENKINIGE
ncbi:MAG: helix-hairpin-helix domain-containing protein [Clostridiales bacterium]|jgi:competence protein ComEA|nr:helix-hairpin-helix domain-containing protein [Clostridiales bacterium]